MNRGEKASAERRPSGHRAVQARAALLSVALAATQPILRPLEERRGPRWLWPVVITVLLALAGEGIAFVLLGERTRSGFDGSLTIGHLFKIDHLSPFIGISNEAYLFYALLYDFLFSVDVDGQTYVPNIAESSYTSDGGRTWVYRIRQGVKWHDGTDLTADDVAFTVNYNIQNFWLLWAYEPYLNQVTQCQPGQTEGCGAEVTGDGWNVTVHFDRSFAPGGSAMIFPILQKRQWQGISAQDAQYSYPNANPIGTGAYKADPKIYEAWLGDQPLVLHANPDYHFGAPKIPKIVFRHFGDENTMVAALLRGDIDVAMLSAAGFEAVKSTRLRSPVLNESIEQQEGPTVIHYWIDIGITQINHPGVNRLLNPARFDLGVRQAMAHATDKEFIIRQFYRGKGLVGSTMMSPVSPLWHYEPTPEETYEYDLAKAKAILDAAGYTDRDPDGIRKAARDIRFQVHCSPENTERGCQENITIPKGQRLSFSMVTRVEAPEEKEIARYLQQSWRDIGIELCGRDCATPEITVEEETVTMTPDVYGGQFDTYIWWWSGDADPNYILSIQSNFTLNGWSDNYFDNKTYNELYLKHLEAMDRVERQQYAAEAQRVHYEAAPFIILTYPFFHYAWWTDEFEGWGDMNADPGRQIGAFWGKHPLFLDLQPKPGAQPTTIPASPLLPYVSSGIAVGAAAAIAVVMIVYRRRAKDEPSLPVPPTPPPASPPTR